MSRVGKQIIALPQNTEVLVGNGLVTVKGPLGELTRSVRPEIAVLVEGSQVTLKPENNDLTTMALWGTYAAHLANMVSGVNKPFEKILILEGVGFKSEVAGDSLNLALGFSHPVKIKIPEGVTVKAEKNVITMNSIDVEKLGQFAAFVRAKKKPEPYKGKGLRYKNEVIRRKEGKKTA